jgi:hypothetical protein
MTVHQGADLQKKWNQRLDRTPCNHPKLELEWNELGYLMGDYVCILCGESVVQEPLATSIAAKDLSPRPLRKIGFRNRHDGITAYAHWKHCKRAWHFRMNWVRAITGILILWSTTAWGATLTWDANSEPDLAGYRVYQCSELPCTLKSGASLLAKVEKNKTSLNIGTPTRIQYYFVTAYGFAKNESGASNVVVFKPASAIADSRSSAIDTSK